MIQYFKKEPYIIAEIGVNHDGQLNKAIKLIEAAAECGANAVKFQSFKTDEITTTSGNDSIIHESRHITIKIPPGETPIVSTITLIVTDYNGGNSTAATFSVVRKGPKKKSKYELWKEKQRL